MITWALVYYSLKSKRKIEDSTFIWTGVIDLAIISTICGIFMKWL